MYVSTYMAVYMTPAMETDSHIQISQRVTLSRSRD